MRTTPEEVLKIMDDPELSDDVVNAYIQGANALINQALSGAGLPEVLLIEIEKWMAAHMIASTRERTSKKEGAGGAFIEYTGQYGMGLNATPYGQMVLALDTTGNMAALGGKAVKMIAIKSFD